MVLEVLATTKSLIEVHFPPGQCEYFSPVLPPFNTPRTHKPWNKKGICYSETSRKDSVDFERDRCADIGLSENDSITYVDVGDFDSGNSGGVNFLRLKLPCTGPLFEEQEISAFVTECPYADLPLPYLSSRSSAPSPFESVYSEPIYNHSSVGDSNFTESNLSLNPWSHQSSIYGCTDNNYNASTYSFGQSSLYWSNQPPPRPPDCADAFPVMRTLPPPPSNHHTSKHSELSPNETTNKFSSIAKTAGRKLAKKLFSMRRASRTISCDLDGKPENVSHPCDVSPRFNRLTKDNNDPKSTVPLPEKNHARPGSSGSSSVVRRSIPRPSSPPPEPPPMESIPRYNATRHNSSASSIVAKDDEQNCNRQVQKLKSTQFFNPSNNLSTCLRNSDNFDTYEDSDFYDSDSDLIRSFVLAYQPIYSMDEEPLYQYYTYGISSLKPEDDYQPVIPKNLGLTLDMLVPRVGQRTLWCEIPEVVSSGILAILSDKQKQLQEAIFEVLTSEVSYLKSLDVVTLLFYESSELKRVLTEEEFRYIWGNIIQVRKCSQSFHAELLGKWKDSWYIQEIGETLNKYALNNFTVYKEYCRNKPHQDRTIQRLRMTNDDFVSAVKSIEENPKCQMLRMDSFLMLPMQRITRLPLLVNAIIQRQQSLKERTFCEEALQNLTNLVLDCNEAARESQDKEDTTAIIEKIDLPRNFENLTLGNFILKGDFMKNPYDHSSRKGANQINWTFRKTKKVFYWLILFSEKLLVTKKKSSGRFEVIDWAETSDSDIKPLPNLDSVSKDAQFFFMLHFTTKETVYFLGARTQSEIHRWQQKLDGLKNEMKTKVEAMFPYEAQREDEMSFDAGDIIRVVQKQEDGWCFGMKISDDPSNSESGWFPANYCCEYYSFA